MYDSTSASAGAWTVIRDLLPPALLVADDAEHRMKKQMDLPLAPVDLGADGVDEERHVVVHDFEDGVLERPAVRLDRRIEETDFRLAGLTLGAELPERQCAAEQRVRRGVDDVVGCNEGEVAADEVLGAVSKILPGRGCALRRRAGRPDRSCVVLRW